MFLTQSLGCVLHSILYFNLRNWAKEAQITHYHGYKEGREMEYLRWVQPNRLLSFRDFLERSMSTLCRFQLSLHFLCVTRASATTTLQDLKKIGWRPVSHILREVKHLLWDTSRFLLYPRSHFHFLSCDCTIHMFSASGLHRNSVPFILFYFILFYFLFIYF